jgi:hypothetical protein
MDINLQESGRGPGCPSLGSTTGNPHKLTEEARSTVDIVAYTVTLMCNAPIENLVK